MSSNEHLSERPYGGSAILWKYNIEAQVLPVRVDSSHIGAVKAVFNNPTMLLVNVYMPCNSNSNSFVEEFGDVLSKISLICKTVPVNYIELDRDFNLIYHK